MASKQCCKDEEACLMPPDPDSLGGLSMQQRLAQRRVRDPSEPFSLPTGTRLGLNDGVIFPPEHFAPGTAASRMSRAALERTPLQGPVRVAVVLVDFPDQHMTRTTADFETLFFSLGVMPTKSVREYYREVSNNNVDFVGEVVGPFRMPHPVTYYANGDAGRTSMPPNARTLAADALAAADSHINFAPYDNDHNGVVDAFVVVHAGRGAEQTQNLVNDLWSLKWVLPRRAFVDGVSVYAFLTIPEDARIGVCSHELGHLVFGWPDHYDTDFSSEGIGNWCLMAGGSWGGTPNGTRPCHPSAWCKAKQGWVKVVNATTNGPLTLRDVKATREVRRLWTNGDLTSQEYFLIENRQQTGFDASLPGAGLFIWHIDDSRDSNDNEPFYKVGLMQADGLHQLENNSAGRGDPGDPYPGSSGNRSFTATTNPDSRAYNGRDTRVSVTNIQLLPNGDMTMDITVL